MKTIYRILVVIGLLVAIAACNDESRLSPEFEYTGPIPAIADGPSEAQKFVMICIRNMIIMYTIL